MDSTAHFRVTAGPARGLRLALATLCAVAFVSASAQAPPKAQVIVTRELQDLYRVAEGSFYIRTKNCNEHVFGDRADLRLNIGIKGGHMVFRNGRTCVIERFLKDFEPSPLDLLPR